MINYHLVTNKQNGKRSWILIEENSDVALLRERTKKKAIKAMREFMKTHPGSVKIHKLNGEIQEERTYPKGNDPHITEG